MPKGTDRLGYKTVKKKIEPSFAEGLRDRSFFMREGGGGGGAKKLD